MDESQQVGYYSPYAALWHGTPQSYVNLHPAGAVSSGAKAARGLIQVGNARYLSDIYHAAMWRGTAASFVDLHPAGAQHSFCYATDGYLQGGYVDWPETRATIWNGSAQSYVTLSSVTSHVYGMVPGIQVGDIALVGGTHAALWRGTPESFVDLNFPGGHTTFYATTGSIHVGDGFISGPGQAHALINFGTPTSWLDLHQFLPPQYTSFSAAKAVCQDGDRIYVGGWAHNGFGDPHAILWIGTVPCYANCDGSSGSPRLTANDFMCFLNTFANRDAAANCDQSTGSPSLTANDFQCFINRYAAGCS